MYNSDYMYRDYIKGIYIYAYELYTNGLYTKAKGITRAIVKGVLL